jgi:hypothetical protein
VTVFLEVEYGSRMSTIPGANAFAASDPVLVSEVANVFVSAALVEPTEPDTAYKA